MASLPTTKHSLMPFTLWAMQTWTCPESCCSVTNNWDQWLLHKCRSTALIRFITFSVCTVNWHGNSASQKSPELGLILQCLPKVKPFSVCLITLLPWFSVYRCCWMVPSLCYQTTPGKGLMLCRYWSRNTKMTENMPWFWELSEEKAHDVSQVF